MNDPTPMNDEELIQPEVSEEVTIVSPQKSEKPAKKEKNPGGDKGPEVSARVGLPRSGRIRIPREGMKDLEFAGKLRAEVEEFHGKEVSHKKSRWTRLSVYSVDERPGRFVAVVTHLAFAVYAPPVYLTRVVSTKAEIIEVFGYSFLAKKLYAKLKMDEDTEIVEALN